MNPDLPRTPREVLEIKITALLMGQLSAAEAAEVQAQIDSHPELAALHARLSHAAQLLRESRALPEMAAPVVPLQMSTERREKLLAAFRGKKPESAPTVAALLPPLPAARQRSRWKGRMALAASIAVLLGGALIYMVGAPASSPYKELALKSAPVSSDAWYEHSLASLAPAESAPLPQTDARAAAISTAPNRPASVKFSTNGSANGLAWQSQPGTVRSLGVETDAANLRFYQYRAQNGGKPSATPAAASMGSGQVIPQGRGLVDGTRATLQQAGGAGVYLPPAELAAPAAPNPSEPNVGKEIASKSNLSDLAFIPQIAAEEKPVSASVSTLQTESETDGNGRTTATRNLKFGGMATEGRKEQAGTDSLGDVSRELTRQSVRGDASGAGLPATGIQSFGTTPMVAESRLGRVDGTTNEFDSLSVARAGATSPVDAERASLEKLREKPGAGSARNRAEDEVVKQLDADAKNYADFGRYKLADRKYEEILEKDPNNIAAQKGLKEVRAREETTADNFETAARSQATGEVSSLWARPYRRFDNVDEIRDKTGKPDEKKDSGVVQLDDLQTQLPESKLLGEISGGQTNRLPRLNVVTAGENTYWDTPWGFDTKNAAARSKSGRLSGDAVAGYGVSIDGGAGIAKTPRGPENEGLVTTGALYFSGGTSGISPTLNPGDFDRGISNHTEAAFINKPDEGNARSDPANPTGNKIVKDNANALAKQPETQDGLKSEQLSSDSLPALLGLGAPTTAGAKAKVPAKPAGGTEPAPVITPAQGVDPAQEAFVNGFLKVRKAEEQAAAGDSQKALENYREAAETLTKIKEQWPKWQPELLEYRLKRTSEALVAEETKLGKKPADAPVEEGKKDEAKSEREKTVAESAPAAAPAEPPAQVKAAEPPPIPQPEVSTTDNAFSTFSLNVSDVSFQLAAASLEKGQMPEPASVRSEEFINALNYRDPEPAAGLPLAFASERARYPFAHNRDLLRISIKTAAAGREQGRPLNLVLLLDNSGSMERADRVRILQESLRVLTKQLQPQDKLSLITFSRNARLWADGVSADKAAEFAERVSEITPQGGTDLSAAMDLGYQTALKHYQPGTVNRVVLLTDGAANLGEVKAETLKEKVEAHRKQGIAFDCFGVGWEGYNDDLLEQLSRNGDGRYGFINTPEAAATEFAGQLAGALRVAASDVKVQVEFNPRRVLAYRQIGYAKHQLKKEQFRDNTVDAAEIGAAESGNALYAIEVNPRGEGDIAIVRARFKTPGTTDYHEHEWTVPFQAPAPAVEQASSSLRLAASAGAFSEWLAQSPFAAEVTTDRLLGLMSGLPAIYGADPRPAKLEAMIRQAKSISGR